MRQRDKDKAVKVAKDVLAQLRAKKYISTQGVYFTAEAEGEAEACDLRDMLPQIKSCNVCAKGALLTSYASLYDKTKVGVDSIKTPFNMWAREEYSTVTFGYQPSNKLTLEANSEAFNERLKEAFPGMKVDLLEIAFEASEDQRTWGLESGYEYGEVEEVEADLAANLYGNALYDQTMENIDAKLRLLMLNIIRNKGEFVVPQQFYRKARKINKEALQDQE